MRVKGIIFEDFVNYKKPAMTIMMPYCDFKCDRESGTQICQNYHLIHESTMNIDDVSQFLQRYYVHNDITKAVVFQGLEPFDSFNDLELFIYRFTEVSDDDIVIYTGYKEEEIEDKVKDLINIIEGNTLVIKYGRFIPDATSKYDEVLGVTLASDNQYAKIVNR